MWYTAHGAVLLGGSRISFVLLVSVKCAIVYYVYTVCIYMVYWYWLNVKVNERTAAAPATDRSE